MRTLDRRLTMMMALSGMLVLIAGCGSLGTGISRPEDSAARAEAELVISNLSNQNSRLKNFKGIGKIKIRQNQTTRIDERIA